MFKSNEYDRSYMAIDFFLFNKLYDAKISKLRREGIKLKKIYIIYLNFPTHCHFQIKFSVP